MRSISAVCIAQDLDASCRCCTIWLWPGPLAINCFGLDGESFLNYRCVMHNMWHDVTRDGEFELWIGCMIWTMLRKPPKSWTPCHLTPSQRAKLLAWIVLPTAIRSLLGYCWIFALGAAETLLGALLQLWQLVSTIDLCFSSGWSSPVTPLTWWTK